MDTKPTSASSKSSTLSASMWSRLTEATLMAVQLPGAANATAPADDETPKRPLSETRPHSEPTIIAMGTGSGETPPKSAAKTKKDPSGVSFFFMRKCVFDLFVVFYLNNICLYCVSAVRMADEQTEIAIACRFARVHQGEGQEQQ